MRKPGRNAACIAGGRGGNRRHLPSPGGENRRLSMHLAVTRIGAIEAIRLLMPRDGTWRLLGIITSI